MKSEDVKNSAQTYNTVSLVAVVTAVVVTVADVFGGDTRAAVTLELVLAATLTRWR